jgi:hypothetical protein
MLGANFYLGRVCTRHLLGGGHHHHVAAALLPLLLSVVSAYAKLGSQRPAA